MKTFGEIVKESRKAKGLTLEKLAKPCGTHKGYISGIENGQVRAPSTKVIAKLCKKLDLDLVEMTTLAFWEKRPKAVTAQAIFKLISPSVPAAPSDDYNPHEPSPAAAAPPSAVAPAPAPEAAAS